MGACYSPFFKDGSTFPCGKCLDCRKRRASGWSYRLLKEAEVSTSAFFITLTYNPESVPITKKLFMSLDQPINAIASRIKDRKLQNVTNESHTQKFIKALRKKNKKTLKYYLVGEYGGKTQRPHYHIILFNAELHTLIGVKLAKQVDLGTVILDGKHHFEDTPWKHGTITIGSLTPASAAYTMKYISKTNYIGFAEWDDRVPQYANMSKGLGGNHLTDNMIAWHKADLINRMHIVLKDGIKIAMPRYYKDKIYTKWQRQKISVELQNKLNNEHNALSYQQQEKNFEKDSKLVLAKHQKNTYGNKNTSESI